MKILYISHIGYINGAPKSLLEYLENIKEKGVTPIVLLPQKGNFRVELNKKGIRNRIIPYSNCVYKGERNYQTYVNYFFHNIKAIKEIVSIIKKEKIDIVHSNTQVVDVGAIAALIAGIPHVWHFREYVKEDFELEFLFPHIQRLLVKKSVACIAIADGIKQKFDALYNIKTICMYNGIKKDSYYCPIDTKTSEKNSLKLLLAGSISEEKGQIDAIRAVEILVKRGINVELLIIGDGDRNYIDKLKSYVKKQALNHYITFLKFTNELQEIRKQSDVILVCSKKEAFGRVTAEAMMTGKLVIGSNSGGTPELIGANEERGYLYPFSSSEQLADKIEYVFGHIAEVYEKEKTAQDFILRITDVEKYTDKLIKIYSKILMR